MSLSRYSMLISEGLTVNNGFCCLFRMEAGSLQVGVSISGFLVQHGAEMSMLLFHSDVQKMYLLCRLFQAENDFWMKVTEILVEFL